MTDIFSTVAPDVISADWGRFHAGQVFAYYQGTGRPYNRRWLLLKTNAKRYAEWHRNCLADLAAMQARHNLTGGN